MNNGEGVYLMQKRQLLLEVQGGEVWVGLKTRRLEAAEMWVEEGGWVHGA